MLRPRSLMLAFALTTLASAPGRASVPPPHSALPWLEDDYPKAVALAKARELPIFVEAWAPW